MVKSDNTGRVSIAFATLALLVLAACGVPPERYLEKGNLLANDGKYAEASLNYRRAIEKKPDFGEAYYRLGMSEFALGKRDSAVGALHRAVELMPANAAAKVELADVTMTQYLMSGRPQKLYDEVSRLTGQILQDNPGSAEGLRLRGSLRLGDGKIDAAIDDFSRANQIEPLNPEITLPLADALARNGKAADGERLALATLDKHPHFIALYEWLFDQYRAAGRVSDAEQMLLRRVSANPDDATGYEALASFYRSSGNTARMTAVLHDLTGRATIGDRFEVAGDFHASLRDWSAAETAYRAGIASGAANGIDLSVRLARVLAAENKLPEALQTVDDALKRDPANLDAGILRASILVARGDWENAQQECEDLLKTNPESAAAHYWLGRARLLGNDAEGARRNFERAADADGRYIEPRLALANLAVNRRDFRDALRLSEQVLAIAPEDFEARLIHADALIFTGDHRAESEIAALQKAAPDSLEVRREMGLFDLSAHKPAEAISTLESVRAAHPGDVRTLAGLTTAYAQQKRLPEALAMLNAETSRSPNVPEVRAMHASVAGLLGRTDIAIEDYKVLVNQVPSSQQYQLLLGQAYGARDDREDELACYQAAYRIAPTDANVVGLLATAYQRTGHLKEADSAYRHSLELNPASPDLMNNRAYFLADTHGDLSEALTLAQKAIQREPNNPEFLDTLALVYVDRNSLPMAIETLSRALQIRPASPLLRYHLALAYFRSGDKSSARKQLGLALAGKPDKKDEAQMRDLLRQVT